tara:strand:+ start:1656 stop:1925 length:270 start_codon:yes stop_codon:yes gene_type:complete
MKFNFLKRLCPNNPNKNKISNEPIIEEKHTYISYKLSNTDNLHECVICLENMINNETVTLTECFHMYHKKCIDDWLKISNICPLCDFKL